MYLRLCLVTLCLTLAAISSPVKRNAATVKTDLTKVGTDTDSLGASVIAFPNKGGTLPEAFAIHNAAVNLDNAVKTATSDTSASTPFSETDGNTILGLLEALVPKIREAATDLVNKKPAFENASIPTSFILSDLEMLKSDTDPGMAALVAKTPADLVGPVKEQVTSIDSALGDAITAYS